MWSWISKNYDLKLQIYATCWEKSINGNCINGLLMHVKRVHYGTFQKKCFLLYVHISHVNSLVLIFIFVWMLMRFPGILFSECQDIEGVADMSARVLWHFITRLYKCKEHLLIGKYSLVKRHMVILYDTIEEKYAVTRNLSCLLLFLLLST